MATKQHHVSIVVPEGTIGQRIDRYLASLNDVFPRAASTDSRTVFLINGNQVKKSKAIKPNDTVEVHWVEELFDKIEPQDIPLSILYEDGHMLVIDKQQSLVVHPGAGNWDNTLVNALVYRYGEHFFTKPTSDNQTDDDEEDLSGFSDIRPGIVHRLDKDTSGVMVIAKDRSAHIDLSSQFKERSIEKYYIVLVHGRMPSRRGYLETTIVRDPRNRKRFIVGKEGEGKHAKTDYLVLRQWSDMALVRVRLHTGRTHQIRVHLSHIGCPIMGDPIYGRRNNENHTMMLHAFSLELSHPSTGIRLRFRAPLPQRFKDVIRAKNGK